MDDVNLLDNYDSSNELEESKSNYLEQLNTCYYPDEVSYITDLHLPEKIISLNLNSESDKISFLDKVTDNIAIDKPTSSLEILPSVKLIGGDISNDIDIYEEFMKLLSTKRKDKYFLTLGNHELWPFDGDRFEEIVNNYKYFLSKHNMFLVQNNIYFFKFNFSLKEITSDELEKISIKDLRERLREAGLIIFGGIGFAGKNKFYNANLGIYKNIINREEEIDESNKFEYLYHKVVEAAYDKNVIILTHMPIGDWTNDEPVKGFVYVNGHTHHNVATDDGNIRIYSNNQIGYKNKKILMKHLSIGFNYDFFSDYMDGIFEIDSNKYNAFYIGINKFIDFNRSYDKLFMLKKNNNYLFLMKNDKGILYILDGGRIRKALHQDIKYYYDNLYVYSESIKLFLSEYKSFEEKISNEIKRIGGIGTIHGCIVDVDYFNHVYINPLDGKVSYYTAKSIVDKYFYENISSLLYYNRQDLYRNLLNNNSNSYFLPLKNEIISKNTVLIKDTDMYKASRIIRSLQYTTNNNVVRLWNDNLLDTISIENGKKIVSGLLEISIKDKNN